jgi:tetratricopeptide (TPR) repeat protein
MVKPSALLPLRTQWLGILVLVALVAVTFWPTLRNGFIWDDDLLLYENSVIKSPDGLRDLWFSIKPIDYFPITYTDFWFEWRLWGMNAMGYHVTNVLLHAINAVLLWRVLREILVTSASAVNVFDLAWFGAALYALHPVNVATVAWIAERKNTMAMMFALLTAHCYLSAGDDSKRSQRLYIGSLVFFLLSLLSKTAGVMLPSVFLCIAWWKRGLTKRDIMRAVPFFAIAFVMGLVTIWFQNHRAMAADFPNRPLLLRIAGVGPAIWFYIGKALLPINLSPVYPQWTIDPHALISYIPHVCIAAVLVVLWVQQQRWGRGPFVTLAAFLLMLLPVVGLVNVNFHKFSLVADHWQYFSLPVAAAAIVWAVAKIFANSTVRTTVLAVALVTFAALSWNQSTLYSTSRMWRATLDKNPNSYVAANNLAEDLQERGELDEALKYFQRSLEIFPDYRHALMGEASVYLHMKKFNEAIPPLEELLKVQPDNFFVRFNVGSAYLFTGKPKPAIEQFRAALQIPPDNIPQQGQWRFVGDDSGMRAELQTRLGDAYMAIGNNDEAVKTYQSALELNPNLAGTHYRIATVIGQKHDRMGARKHLREVLRIAPGNLDGLNDLAWSFATDPATSSAEKAEAKQLATQAAELTKFSEPGQLDTLAAACAATGDFDEAVKYGKQAQALATAKGDKQFAADLERRNILYAKKHAYTE